MDYRRRRLVTGKWRRSPAAAVPGGWVRATRLEPALPPTVAATMAASWRGAARTTQLHRELRRMADRSAEPDMLPTSSEGSSLTHRLHGGVLKRLATPSFGSCRRDGGHKHHHTRDKISGQA